MTAVLNITDGTTTINLIGTVFRLVEDPRWRPQLPTFKSGGVWQSSPFSDGRRLASTNYDNVVDAWTLHVVSSSQDDVIYSLQELRRLLNKGVQYWTTDWQDEPVWIEARASCESNTRYAILHSYQTPEDDDPYQSPFAGAAPGVAMNDIQLIIEHGIWTDSPPGVGTSLSIAGKQDACLVVPLLFDGVDDYVNYGSPAVLDNLHDNAFTVEAWIRPTDDRDTIAGKRYWYFRVDAGYALQAYIDCAVVGGSQLTTTTITPGEWSHVAMTWDDATYLRPRIWINGVEATYNAGAGSDRNGAVIADAAESLWVGLLWGPVDPFSGHIGWIRISNNVRYTAAFTPPSRCILPSTDANTVNITIFNGIFGDVFDISGNGTDGVKNGAVWDRDQVCCEEFGQDDTTAETVYIANHYKQTQLTHVFYYDASVPSYSANLLDAALPYALLPAVPAVGDICYFGIITDAIISSSFVSLVFDIGTAQTNITTLAWEYWNGAWVALTTVNDLSQFAATGVHSINWASPTDIATTAINGIGGYWIRVRVTAVGGGPTPPTQQNRNVYTVSWNYVNVDNVSGDIVANLLARVKNVGIGTAGSSCVDRVICGLRSVDRGDNFVTHLAASDGFTNKPVGISTAYGANTTQQGSSVSLLPVGRYVTGAAGTAMASEVIYTIDDSIASEYYGRYHAFVVQKSTRTAGAGTAAISVRVAAQSGSGGSISYSDITTLTISAAATRADVLDCGVIVVPGGNVKTSEIGDLVTIAIQIGSTVDVGTQARMDVEFLVLMPVDEWAGDFAADRSVTAADLANNTNLTVDSITYPKSPIRAILRDSSSFVKSFYSSTANGGAILQSNKHQRLWFFFIMQETYNETIPEWLFKVTAQSQSRYLSMRGAR